MSTGISAAVLAATLAGCAPTSGGFPHGVSAALIQQRSDVEARQVQVRVRNDSDAAITVGDVTLDDERFDGAGTRAVQRESSLAAGASVDVRVALPPMDCATADDGAPRVTLHLVVAGNPVTATSDVDDVLDVLPALHARECLGERLAAVAAVEIAAFTEAPPGEEGMLTLAVTPAGTGAARLVSVAPTPLLTFDEAAAAPYELDRDIGTEPVSIDIPLVPQRCDPHVVQEDKRGTVFSFAVDVGGVTGDVDIPASPEMKARMLSWVAHWCGFGG